MFKKKNNDMEKPLLKSELEILEYLKNQCNMLQSQYDLILKNSGDYVTYVDTIKLGNIQAIFAFINHLINFIEGANAESIEK